MLKMIYTIIFTTSVFASYKDYVGPNSPLNKKVISEVSPQLIIADPINEYLKSEKIILQKEYKKNALDKYKVFDPAFKKLNAAHYRKLREIDSLILMDLRNFIWEKKFVKNKDVMIVITNDQQNNVNNALNLIRELQNKDYNYSIQVVISNTRYGNIGTKAFAKKYKTYLKAMNVIGVISLNQKSEQLSKILTIITPAKKSAIKKKADIFLEIIKQVNTKRKIKYQLDKLSDFDSDFTCYPFNELHITCLELQYGGDSKQHHTNYIGYIEQILDTIGQ
jgi:Trp operon repressor